MAQRTVPLTARDATELVGVRELRTDIEALRAIAILLVVAFHCHVVGIPGGFMGVDVFYVLSGYLITGLLVTETERTATLRPLRFYAKRVRRLLPAAALVSLTTLVVGAFLFAPRELMLTAHAARANALYVSNLYFSESASDYFSARVTFNPLLHTWSLSVEEQFYLLWPLIIALGLLVWRSKGALIASMAVLTIVSFAVNLWLTGHDRVVAFYALPTRAWEFGLGGLAALIPRGSLRFGRATWVAIGWLGLAVILGSALLVRPSMAFPGWLALFPVIGTALALLAGAECPLIGVGTLFNTVPLQTLGGLSYSWYLWHWPFLVFTAAIFPAASGLTRVVAASISLGVAYVTHRCFENPIRHYPALVKSPKLTLAVGSALTALSLVVATLALHFSNHLERTPAMKALNLVRVDFADLSRSDCISQEGSSAVKTCSFGAVHSSTHLVLFGDSHAAQWFDTLSQLAERRHWRLTTVIKLGCAAVDVNPGIGIDSDPECIAWREQAIHDIIGLKPSLIVLGSATNKLDRPENPAASVDSSLADDVREGVLNTLRALHPSGATLALLRDTPEFPFDVNYCLARAARHSWYPHGACDMPRAKVVDPRIYSAEQAAARSVPNVRLIDLTGELCPQDVCKAVVGGMVMYRDTHHLAGSSAARLGPLLDSQITAALH
ncbi:MAG: acyltransferase [Proteobacteria bacterium]|nr:acyltransferase [Pseudomonadota bacterium]